MTVIRFIGDVHGKFDRYKRLIKDVPRSIQVGDMGVGFRHYGGPRDGEFSANPPYDAMRRGEHRFIRGNHDNPGACRRHSQWIPDGHIESDMMFIGGAVSIDRAYRIEGYNWWPDEELSTPALHALVDLYIKVRPRIMVTHDCPEDVAVEIVRSIPVIGKPVNMGKLDPQFASRTRQALQSMWSAHSPKLWIFGHWHVPFDHVLNGARFKCLAELESYDIMDMAAI